MSQSQKVIKKVRIMHTSDVHAALFTHDFTDNKPARGGLSRICSIVERERLKWGDRLILLDGGDVLQGQPAAYYYNFIRTDVPHLVADVMNYMNYDAMCIGNHDLEMGHAVYDRFRAQCHFPVLGANLLDEHTGEPYFSPYKIIERDGLRIAVLGLVTSAIPHWVPQSQWHGIKIEEMVSAARYWVEKLRREEKPDLMVGLFHSGWKNGIQTDTFLENATRKIALEVDGFDLICYGHDHQKHIEVIQNQAGNKVCCVGLWSLATCVSRIDVTFFYEDGCLVGKSIQPHVLSALYESGESVFAFERYFADATSEVARYVNHRIGFWEHTMSSQDAYFGSSAFIDLIHELQLKISGADISFAAPLSFDASIHRGAVYVRDMFHLYKYENMLCTLFMTGAEIRGILEMSYALWTNEMKSADDHIMLLGPVLDQGRREGFVNLAFNFDSAAGIRYTVDVTKPQGSKIKIQSMADGTPFSEEKKYLVVTNSYRANGGGELFTVGAGISHQELLQRICTCSEKDIRYYFIQYIEQQQDISARAMGHWHFVPEEWAVPACSRDRAILFGK